MFKKTFSNFLTTFLSFQLIVGQNFIYAADTAGSYDRTNQQIESFMKNSVPSEIPFIEYMEQFVRSHTKPIEGYNLNQFVGKKAFVGYGVYDKGQNFCKYIEQPGLDPTKATDKLETYFTTFGSFNNRSYAVSLNQMSYDNCVQLTNKFGGYPVSISNYAENAYVAGRYSNVKWLGIERADCLSPYYAKDGKLQDYFNWSSKIENTDSCNPGELLISQNQFGTWNKTNEDSLKYCVMEINSPEINRPTKICAPWWRIEREYEKEKQTNFSGVDIYSINQADIPENFNVCTRYQSDINMTAEQNKPPRTVTCTSYYDATVAPECINNTIQPICYVDECAGYIKNACRLTEQLTPLKDYTKTQVEKNGAMVWIKGKDQIKTNVYSCPPSPVSLKKCEEESSVIIYPKECPGSQCDALKQCIYNATTTADKTACSTTYTCTKIYGNPDLPVFDANNKLTGLEGYCPDGSKLFFQANIQDKESKKCIKYDSYEVTEEVTQKCVLNRTFADYTVDMSITGSDIYMNNPDCIRLNNLIDARPLQIINLKYKNNGYGKNVMKRALINGNNDLVYEGGSTEYFTDAATKNLDMFGNPSTAEVPTINVTGSVTSSGQEDTTCNIFDSTWDQRNNLVFTKNGTYDSSVYGLYMKDDGSAMYIKFYNITSDANCATKKTEKGGTSYSYDAVTDICLVYTPRLTGDIFRVMKGDDPATFITKNAITKQQCSSYASCLGGTFNSTSYQSAATSECEISVGDNLVPESTATTTEVVVPLPGECVPTPVEGTYQTQLDGTQDIFFVEEDTEGAFGYYSNYTSHPYKHNFISIDNKEILPLKEIPIINDPLVYESKFTQVSILSKSPNWLIGGIAGVGSGMAVGSFGTGLPIAIAVTVIVAAIFGKKQKYNEQNGSWIVYKLVPINRYVQNIYGYDHRIIDRNADGTPKLYGNTYKLIYWKMDWSTGTQKPGDFLNIIKSYFNFKKTTLMCGGWFSAEIPKVANGVEENVVVGYPSCKWYDLSCDKRNTGVFNYNKNPFYKRMNNVYMGASNTVTVVVPYLGDYEVKAYDKNENLLAQTTIYEGEFLQVSEDKAKYAQAMFGRNMDLASGVSEGTTRDACRFDLMVEWGGGVSGIYYENDTTGVYSGCAKSNDTYVKDHAATKLTIRPLNSDTPFVINLTKPNPFPNRIFIATLNEKEVRMYRCFDPFQDCLSENFKTVTDGGN